VNLEEIIVGGKAPFRGDFLRKDDGEGTPADRLAARSKNTRRAIGTGGERRKKGGEI